MSHQPLLRFGVIADPQYADLEPNTGLDRHFRNSLGKLAEAIATFEGEDLSFVMTLGDLIDRDFASFDAPLEIYGRSRHECLFLPGNHDFLVAPDRLPQVFEKLGMPAPYYAFTRSGIRFLVIDGCEESLFSTVADPQAHAAAKARLSRLRACGAINAMDWNAGISRRQFAWIRRELQRAEEKSQPVIVMGHFPLYPESDHALWDSGELVDLLTASPQVIAYLCGHYHAGRIARAGGCWFVNFCGMVDTEASNAFALVDVYGDRLEIKGYGRQGTHVLACRPASLMHDVAALHISV
ncbi:metallophosphoesterase [Rhizobium sp. SGZ-381]|uniref:metallophosphoesterase n=1 Tax=Rhizobium sp. SGZ-381 TaxID=3342800 RepID=UPI00366EE383